MPMEELIGLKAHEYAWCLSSWRKEAIQLWHLWSLIAVLQGRISIQMLHLLMEEKKPFKYDYADFQKDYMNKHVASVHEGKNPLKCDNCDYSRYQKTNLNRLFEWINEEKSHSNENYNWSKNNFHNIVFLFTIFYYIPYYPLQYLTRRIKPW